MIKRNKKNLGLTLIELLLATSLFAVVGTVLYSILSQGISVWERSQKEEDSAGEERIILERMASDIRNSFIHSWVNFAGKADEIYFCAYKNASSDIQNRQKALFKVRYFFADENNEDYRQGLYIDAYPVQLSFSDAAPKPRLLSERFKEFHFQFGYWSPVEEKVIYQDTWKDPKVLPKVILIKGKSEKEFEKTIALPLGELVEFQEKETETPSGQMDVPVSETSGMQSAGTEGMVTEGIVSDEE